MSLILYRFNVPEEGRQKLLGEIIEQHRTQPSESSHNIGGWRSSDVLKWGTPGATWFTRELTSIAGGRGLIPMTAWAIVNGYGASHAWHVHVGKSNYSGIVYLQDGGAQTRTLFATSYNSRKRCAIEPIEHVLPILGLGVLFSSRTWHCVEPHMEHGQRITVAFDCR